LLNVVKYVSALTKAATGDGKVVKTQGVATVRASISFPQKEKTISLA
jgi:hypothetical protein